MCFDIARQPLGVSRPTLTIAVPQICRLLTDEVPFCRPVGGTPVQARRIDEEVVAGGFCGRGTDLRWSAARPVGSSPGHTNRQLLEGRGLKQLRPEPRPVRTMRLTGAPPDLHPQATLGSGVNADAWRIFSSCSLSSDSYTRTQRPCLGPLAGWAGVGSDCGGGHGQDPGE
jgi:hypothetical protein